MIFIVGWKMFINECKKLALNIGGDGSVEGGIEVNYVAFACVRLLGGFVELQHGAVSTVC